MYNYNHLYYFYITAKSGGVMKAAKHLRISQPSLSSQLKILESVLDVKLFQKVGRTNQLTRQGTAIYGYCKRMFDFSEEMSEALLQRIPSATRRVYIGVSDEIERSFVVEAVSLFLRRQPRENRPKVTIISGTESQLIEKLKFRELDVIISEKAIKDPDVMNLARVETPVVLAHPQSWKTKANSARATILSVINNITKEHPVQWVVPSSRFKLRSEIDLFFEANKLKGRIILESDVMASIVRSVVDKIGIGFFPLLYIAREVREKSISTVGPKTGYWKYQIWLICNHQSHEDILIQAFSSAFSQVSKNLNC